MFETKFGPPFCVENVSILFTQNVSAKGASGGPDLQLVVEEVKLFTAFALEIEVEPLQKLAREDKQMGEVVMI